MQKKIIVENIAKICKTTNPAHIERKLDIEIPMFIMYL